MTGLKSSLIVPSNDQRSMARVAFRPEPCLLPDISGWNEMLSDQNNLKKIRK